MTRLRIGFLIPPYRPGSKSYTAIAMRLLADAGVAVDILSPTDRSVDLEDVRVEHDLYVAKQVSGFALSLAGVLHARGAAIVNPYPATLALRDKIETFTILKTAGVSVPATYIAPHVELLAPLLDAGPLVVKPYQGEEGRGIRVIRHSAELADIAPGTEPIFAQRYHRPRGRDRKMYGIGGRVFGVKRVFPAGTEAEKLGEPFTPTPELREIVLRCGRAFGIDLYGVDIIESDGRPYVVDMSSMPGFKGVPDAPRLLADYFRAAAERVARGRPALEAAGAQ